MLPHPVQIINWLTFYIKSLFEVHWINSWQYCRPLYNMSFNDMIYTKLLNAYRINSIHSEKLLAIWIHIQKLQLFDKTFVAFFILYKFHGTLIEMNLNTHIFSQKRKLRLSYFYRNIQINPGTFFRLPVLFIQIALFGYHFFFITYKYQNFRWCYWNCSLIKQLLHNKFKSD